MTNKGTVATEILLVIGLANLIATLWARPVKVNVENCSAAQVQEVREK